ncbi:hypothetical protein J2S40_002160 [Nocardioides luteus]|uniref:DUF3037 domain-containing protein n=1 Tax=Nocardioides luteus TaxID=1844 RepID=A0ABQ5SSR3_9ACTN|nr:DUF3037 domain-containing protein [Nocardioides luteus]MDR7311102.1 hypothetical protein [Nocardioides luteus]GGR62286.1 hypothetical protein GCM10010197_31900 [Nocardioides luteus]GLJ66648.1 hypothetical protein GCM10017579_06840 [Nocardioides luteus]
MDAYQYVVLRCVPRPEREEFLNVGVVLFCPEQKFLAAKWSLDEQRLATFAPGLDLSLVRAALESVDLICAGDAHSGFGVGIRATAYGVRALSDNESARFGLLKAPKSTVLQPGPVHGGVTTDATAELDRIFAHQVG